MKYKWLHDYKEILIILSLFVLVAFLLITIEHHYFPPKPKLYSI